WLTVARAWQDRAPRVEWARRFSQWLGAAGFGRGAGLDSRDAQRLQRWNELLDEFAALDSIGEPPVSAAALDELLGLADQSRHAARTGDAAITLTAERGAPLAGCDGIWVLGLAEQRWPEPPRPDPYVPLAEQRRCGWDEAGARQRLEQAQWSLRQWRAATHALVLSYPRLEGDVHHRPSALPGLALPHDWKECSEAATLTEPYCTLPAVPPSGLAPLPAGEADQALDRGLQRLRLQQACAFRAQAQIRLGAKPAPVIGDGIHPAVRGILLHGVLDGLWRELRDQRALNALDEEGRRALFGRHWALQLSRLAADGRPRYAPRLLERERLRSERLVLRILAMEEERPFFRVVSGERPLQLATPAGVIRLRLDRLDEDEQGHRWLIDYKSGKPETFRLAQGEAQPAQLVLYEQALAAQDEAVRGVVLLSLAPAQAGFSGAAPDQPWPGKWQLIPDWDVQRMQWREELATLLREHAQGRAAVAPLRDACRTCHLTALCRRADPDAGIDPAEQDDD
ncbi:MAG TPA: PD-(D/E)XK nuclease family protein, partial [Steroidobacteraceae bacterium]|nr:PD-(D/E)XK nuclease family protein [Steroidobacteraceae bacterium]